MMSTIANFILVMHLLYALFLPPEIAAEKGVHARVIRGKGLHAGADLIVTHRVLIFILHYRLCFKHIPTLVCEHSVQHHNHLH